MFRMLSWLVFRLFTRESRGDVKAVIVIKSCTCQHAFQDQEYGKYKRVHNLTKKTDKSPQKCRCTVCGDVKEVDS
jgi:hypothetical protein